MPETYTPPTTVSTFYIYLGAYKNNHLRFSHRLSGPVNELGERILEPYRKPT